MKDRIYSEGKKIDLMWSHSEEEKRGPMTVPLQVHLGVLDMRLRLKLVKHKCKSAVVRVLSCPPSVPWFQSVQQGDLILSELCKISDLPISFFQHEIPGEFQLLGVGNLF